MDGVDIIKKIRSFSTMPIIVVSARTEDQDKVDALDAGADDYLTKPFHFEELEARVRSLTRRKFVQEDVCLLYGEISFDTKARIAYAKGQAMALTRKESALLEYLLLH